MILLSFLELFELRQIGFVEEIFGFTLYIEHEAGMLSRREGELIKKEKRKRVQSNECTPFIDKENNI